MGTGQFKPLAKLAAFASSGGPALIGNLYVGRALPVELNARRKLRLYAIISPL